MWRSKAIHSAKPQLLPQLMDYASVAPEAVAFGLRPISPTDRPTSDDSGAGVPSIAGNLCGKRPGKQVWRRKMRLLKLIPPAGETAGAAKQFVPGLGNDSGID